MDPYHYHLTSAPVLHASKIDDVKTFKPWPVSKGLIPQIALQLPFLKTQQLQTLSDVIVGLAWVFAGRVRVLFFSIGCHFCFGASDAFCFDREFWLKNTNSQRQKLVLPLIRWFADPLIRWSAERIRKKTKCCHRIRTKLAQLELKVKLFLTK